MAKKRYAEFHRHLDVGYQKVSRKVIFYPENELSQMLMRLIRRKAFTKQDIELLRDMGFTVNVRPRSWEIPKVWIPDGGLTDVSKKK